MKKFHCVQQGEIKEILIIIIKRGPVFTGFLCANICAKKLEENVIVVL